MVTNYTYLNPNGTPYEVLDLPVAYWEDAPEYTPAAYRWPQYVVYGLGLCTGNIMAFWVGHILYRWLA